MKNDLKEFYDSNMNKLFSNKKLRNLVLNNKSIFNFEHSDDDFSSFKTIMDLHIEEAVLTLSLLDRYKLSKKIDLLEIGGGMGLVYAYLKKSGFNIYSIEPSQSGFDLYYNIAI